MPLFLSVAPAPAPVPAPAPAPAPDNSTVIPPVNTGGGGGGGTSSTIIVVAAAVGGAAVLAVIALVLCCCLCRKKKVEEQDDAFSEYSKTTSVNTGKGCWQMPALFVLLAAFWLFLVVVCTSLWSFLLPISGWLRALCSGSDLCCFRWV